MHVRTFTESLKTAQYIMSFSSIKKLSSSATNSPVLLKRLCRHSRTLWLLQQPSANLHVVFMVGLHNIIGTARNLELYTRRIFILV